MRPAVARLGGVRFRLVSGLALAALAVVVWAANEFGVGRPVALSLSQDNRNSGYHLIAHYHYFVDPSTLVLDLRSIEAASPVDLFRGLFQSAAALRDHQPPFSSVALARGGATVFLMKGSDYRELGRSFVGGENPVYLIRTWPEKLYRPDGTRAFGTWEGGWLGVLGHQMEDATDAGRQWAGEPGVQR